MKRWRLWLTVPDVPGVYIVRDVNGAVLYVGQSMRARLRLRYHTRREQFRYRAHKIDFIGVENVWARLALEKDLQQKLQPALGTDTEYRGITLDWLLKFAPKAVTEYRKTSSSAA